MGFTTAQYELLKANLERQRQRHAPESPGTGSDSPKHASGAYRREEDIAQDILEEIRRRVWICFRSKPTERTGRMPGEPDLHILAGAGRTFHIEIKRPAGGKLSTEQRAVIAWADRLGHKVHVVTSLEEFLAVVDAPSEKPRMSPLHLRD